MTKLLLKMRPGRRRRKRRDVIVNFSILFFGPFSPSLPIWRLHLLIDNDFSVVLDIGYESWLKMLSNTEMLSMLIRVELKSQCLNQSKSNSSDTIVAVGFERQKISESLLPLKPRSPHCESFLMTANFPPSSSAPFEFSLPDSVSWNVNNKQSFALPPSLPLPLPPPVLMKPLWSNPTRLDSSKQPKNNTCHDEFPGRNPG